MRSFLIASVLLLAAVGCATSGTVKQEVAEATASPLGKAAIDALAVKAGVNSQLAELAVQVAQSLLVADGGGTTKSDAAKQGVAAASQKSVEQGTGELTQAQRDALQDGITSLL